MNMEVPVLFSTRRKKETSFSIIYQFITNWAHCLRTLYFCVRWPKHIRTIFIFKSGAWISLSNHTTADKRALKSQHGGIAVGFQQLLNLKRQKLQARMIRYINGHFHIISARVWLPCIIWVQWTYIVGFMSQQSITIILSPFLNVSSPVITFLQPWLLFNRCFFFKLDLAYCSFHYYVFEQCET